MVSIKNRTGLTLSETLITISLIIILTSVLFAVILSSYEAVSLQKAYIDLQQEGAQVISEITRISNLAINVANYPESIPTTYSSGSDTLVLKVNAIDSDKDIIEDTFDYFIFYVENNQLKEKIEADDASVRQDSIRTVAVFVEKIIFGYNKTVTTEADFVYITAILSKTVKEKERQIISQSSAYLRN